MKKRTLGLAMCGSFCTFSRVLDAFETLDQELYELVPIMSQASFETDSRFGPAAQFRERLEQLNPAGVSVIPLMREAVRNWQPDVAPEEVGSVLTVGDEIATVSGLEHAAYGEILQFSSGVKGMVQDLRPDRVGCILFGGSEAIESGSIVRRTGKTAGIPVGDGFLGRVVDALGMPIDGQGDIPSEGYLPIESPAPGIIDRQPVNVIPVAMK